MRPIVISVGGGPSPDGIYLISGDAVGYSAFPKPKHEGSFVDVRPVIQQRLRQYKEEVLSRKYPYQEHVQHMAPQEHDRFLQIVETSRA